MTEQVNWADAPDGAEAYLPHSKEQYFSWLKKDPVTGCTMIFVPGVLQAWTEMGGRRDYPYGHVLRPVTPPAAQVQGEQPVVVGYLLEKGNGQLSCMSAGSNDKPLMTVAQHERIVADNVRWKAVANEQMQVIAGLQEQLRAALSAPPAAGVPEGWKLIPAQPNEAMLNQISPISGKEERLPYWWYQALIKSAPTPPASEQQQAVVVPVALRNALALVVAALEADGDRVTSVTALRELRKALQPAAPSQGESE
ncbi:hypothetical protein [Pseudomonas tohonis]|uniref:hypothetical protein n=1 Tax=Pseudomonas tohonis TaxID=2725477 RepID=UPI0022F00C18|nr:hypothetical protein [Pseudomonas tohonis]